MLGKDIIAFIISEEGFRKDYPFGNEGKKSVRIKEPETLAEIADVQIEYGRVALHVSDPMAARKFGLDDKYVKYEYDGNTMYMYKEEGLPSDWCFDFGPGGCTLVASSVETYRSAVLKEMKRQVNEKGLNVPFYF